MLVPNLTQATDAGNVSRLLQSYLLSTAKFRVNTTPDRSDCLLEMLEALACLAVDVYLTYLPPLIFVFILDSFAGSQNTITTSHLMS